jgi:hypothetical protein
MAKTAMNQLQDQIEAIRREAYQAGYAAAMQAIRDFAGRPAGAAAAPRVATPRAAAPRAATPRAATPRAATPRRAAAKPAAAEKAAPRRRRAPARATASGRPQRGTNARLIVEVLREMPAGTARPADIRKALQSDKGVSMAFTSIRHALGQLAARNEVTASDDGKTWRYVGD